MISCLYYIFRSIVHKGSIPLIKLHTLDLSYNKLDTVNHKLLLEQMPTLVNIRLVGNRFPCYLKSDLESEFLEDNIVFEFSPIEEPCVKPSTQKPVEIDEGNVVSEKLEAEENSGPNGYVIYSFIFIAFALIGVLFFMQFRTFLNSNIVSRRSGSGEVQLICTNDGENEFSNGFR